MKTPGGRGELSLSGPYLAFARGRWRGRGVFLPLPDSPGPSSPSPADPGLAPSSRRGRPSPPRAVEAALRLRPPRGRSPPPRFSCPSGAAASFPQRHTGPAGPASSPGSLNRRLGGPDPAAGSRAGIPVPPPPRPPGLRSPPSDSGAKRGALRPCHASPAARRRDTSARSLTAARALSPIAHVARGACALAHPPPRPPFPPFLPSRGLRRASALVPLGHRHPPPAGLPFTCPSDPIPPESHIPPSGPRGDRCFYRRAPERWRGR